MQIPFYWCNIDNFGDAINQDLFREIFNLEPRWVPQEQASVMAIGSLFDFLLIDIFSDKSHTNKSLKIFGSGFGFKKGEFPSNQNIMFPEKLKRKIQCYAVRGKYTKERLEKITEQDLSQVVLGDPGLLAPYLVTKNKSSKKYRLGIVPHYTDFKKPIFKTIHRQVRDSIIIDITQKPHDVLLQLLECETIASNAMHPLIVADSFNIPNLWLNVADQSNPSYKFNDYYSALNLELSPLKISENDDFSEFVDLIKKQYRVDYKQVQEVQKKLLQAAQKLKKDLIQQFSIPNYKLRTKNGKRALLILNDTNVQIEKTKYLATTIKKLYCGGGVDLLSTTKAKPCQVDFFERSFFGDVEQIRSLTIDICQDYDLVFYQAINDFEHIDKRDESVLSFLKNLPQGKFGSFSIIDANDKNVDLIALGIDLLDEKKLVIDLAQSNAVILKTLEKGMSFLKTTTGTHKKLFYDNQFYRYEYWQTMQVSHQAGVVFMADEIKRLNDGYNHDQKILSDIKSSKVFKIWQAFTKWKSKK